MYQLIHFTASDIITFSLQINVVNFLLNLSCFDTLSFNSRQYFGNLQYTIITMTIIKADTEM